MFKIGGVIDKFSRYVDVFTFTGAYVDGTWQQDAIVTKQQLFGSLQENDGKVIKMLTEGARLEETKVFYSKQSLPIDDLQYNNGENDIRFVIDSVTYRLIANKKWDNDYSVYVLQFLRADNAIPPS